MSTPKIIQDIRDLQSSQSAQDELIAAAKKTADEAKELASNTQGSGYISKYHTVNVDVTNVSSPNPVTSNVNPLPQSWSQVTSGNNPSYTSGGYVISSDVPAREPADGLDKAFNTNYTTAFVPTIGTRAVNITIKLPKPLKVTGMMYSVNSAGLSLSVYGSNTNSDNLSDWTILVNDIKTSGGAVTNNLDLRQNNTLYQYYRVSISGINSDYISIYRLLISAYEIPAYAASFYSEEIPEMTTDERVLIKTPNLDSEGFLFESTGVVSATFQGKPLEALLLPNRYYELVYDGSTYLVKEV